MKFDTSTVSNAQYISKVYFPKLSYRVFHETWQKQDDLKIVFDF